MKVKVGTHNFLENPKRYGGLIFLLPTIEFGFGDFISLPQNIFPSLSCKDEPIEVELTIKKI